MFSLKKIRVFFQVQKSLLLKYGWLKAWRKGIPVDSDGNPMPWITYPAYDFLKQFDYSDCTVFEWGSGFSTMWWSKKCKHITSVESNAKWAEIVSKQIGKNVQYIVTALDVKAELEPFEKSSELYDIISIDNMGTFRKFCCEVSASQLKEGGMIILDNSDQCLEACAVLRKHNFQQIDFTGFAPGAGYAQTTSIFFKHSLRFRTLNSFQPERSVAQPNLPWENC